MIRKFTYLLACLALAACATTGSLTVGQGLYTALGAYATALGAAADYATSPTADRTIVQRLNTINQAPATRAAVGYARAYVDCRGRNDTAPVCASFDFRAATVSNYATTLRSVIIQLGAR